MLDKASFTLRGRNPDVLTCIANLSNDEVFTPPEFANRMLDTLADAWSKGNGGANIWADPTVRFLDPFTKSGVFLREITTRLIAGLAEQMPDLQARVDHILTEQVFGIGITTLTALLARRSLYCSKFANGEHSVAKSFTTDTGNIWFERTEHRWSEARCTFCGAPREVFNRPLPLDNHAYAFIHTSDIKARMGEIFGADMQFDVVIGNPPYQLASDGGTRDVPIYQKFVDAAISLEPKYVIMVTPSRWFAGGLGLDSFRDRMLNDTRIRNLVDFTKMDAVFPGVDFEGGVSYFLWDREYNGPCEVRSHLGDEQPAVSVRSLGEFDIFVRNPAALSILKKVIARNESSLMDIMSTNNEFGLVTNFRDFRDKKTDANEIAVYAISNSRRVVGWMGRKDLPRQSPFIDTWKVLIPKSYGERGAIPAQVLGPVQIAPPPSVATQTYVFVQANSEEDAKSIAAYTRTRFFRFMLSLRKITQHAAKPVYQWVPQQDWSRRWADEDLFRKYALSDEEKLFIEKMIRPMNGGDE